MAAKRLNGWQRHGWQRPLMTGAVARGISGGNNMASVDHKPSNRSWRLPGRRGPRDENRYDAFVSYSHRGDADIAAGVQRGLEKFGKRWNELRALRVFRDKTSLAVTAELWPEIERALAESDWFVLMASPQSAQSHWVNQEIRWWLEHKPADRILIVLTNGTLEWDGSAGDFDWERSSAAPEALRGALAEEPLWVPAVPEAEDAVADIAARIRDVPKDQLVGTAIREHRRTMRLAGGAITGLALLLVAAVVAGAVALVQRNVATSERDKAGAAALSAQSQVTSATDPLLARLEAVAAWQLGHTPAARTAMLQAALLPWDAILSSASASSGQDFSVAFSADGTMLAVGTQGAIQLWSVSTHQLLATLATPGGTSEISSVAFGDDDRLLAALAPGTGVQLWDVATRRLVAEQELPTGEPIASVPSVAFSANGTLIAVTTFQGAELLAVTRQGPGPTGGPGLSSPVLLPGSGIGAVAFSPQGSLLAVGGVYLQLWNVSGQQPRASLRATLHASVPSGDNGTVYGVPAFSPDGSIVAGSTPFGVQLWDAATGRQLRMLSAAAVDDTVAFDSTGQFLAGGGQNGTAQLWDVATGAPIATLATGSSGAVNVAFGPGGTLAVLTPGAIRLADLTAILAINEPRATLASGSASPAVSVTFSPDGDLLAAGFQGGPVMVWNIARWTVLARFQPPSGPALSGAVAFSPDGRLLAAGTEGGNVAVWKVGSPQAPATVFPPGSANQPIDSVAFSSRGDLLAGGTGNGSVLVWEVTSRQPLAPFQPGGDGNPASAVAFSPDGQFLASSSGAGALLWDVATRQEGAVLTLLDNIEGVSSLAFSPDGRLLAAATSSGTQLWNLTASPPTVAAVVPGKASSVAFSSDSAILAVRAGDAVTLWDTSTSQQIGTLAVGGTGGPVAVSPGGTFLADATGDGGISVWGTPYIANPASYLCGRTGQSFPAAAWAQLALGVPYMPAC
jgi:WD40 repeat protein